MIFFCDNEMHIVRLFSNLKVSQVYQVPHAHNVFQANEVIVASPVNQVFQAKRVNQ